MGPEHQGRADKVQAASSHWLRHTMGSRLADGVDLRHIRDTFGHSSLTTTSIYLHAEDDARHAAISATRHRLGLGDGHRREGLTVHLNLVTTNKASEAVRIEGESLPCQGDTGTLVARAKQRSAKSQEP
ncbi:site-specific integrase [Aquabacterium humicola]|uniref:site-specific integrase n=1 Tax=Aquabacterium humicola TaxID=3237377 RepID=UPI002542D794|nr:site-specific integrase [Rubrivivax pictus]